jgi:ribosome-associated protein
MMAGMTSSDRYFIAPGVCLDPADVEMTAMRSSGAGGQNVNKVSTTIHLRFDIRTAALPEVVRRRLLDSGDRRITGEGMLIIKAQSFRTQARNREDALDRLIEILRRASEKPKLRRATRPTRASQERRITTKKKRSANKGLRKKPVID